MCAVGREEEGGIYFCDKRFGICLTSFTGYTCHCVGDEYDTSRNQTSSLALCYTDDGMVGDNGWGCERENTYVSYFYVTSCYWPEGQLKAQWQLHMVQFRRGSVSAHDSAQTIEILITSIVAIGG